MVINESHIYEQFRQGDIQPLYAGMYSSLLAFAARFLGDYALLAEDCVQETIVKAYHTRDTFISPYQLKSFLYTCLRNQCISVLRRSATQKRYQSQDEQEQHDELMARIVEQETLDMLQEAIRQLPEKYRQVFELNYEQGLKTSEAARLMGITIDGFNKRKARMIALLRKHFKNDDLMQLVIYFLLA